MHAPNIDQQAWQEQVPLCFAEGGQSPKRRQGTMQGRTGMVAIEVGRDAVGVVGLLAHLVQQRERAVVCRALLRHQLRGITSD